MLLYERELEKSAQNVLLHQIYVQYLFVGQNVLFFTFIFVMDKKQICKLYAVMKLLVYLVMNWQIIN